MYNSAIKNILYTAMTNDKIFLLILYISKSELKKSSLLSSHIENTNDFIMLFI
jgi:hypothetical protein